MNKIICKSMDNSFVYVTEGLHEQVNKGIGNCLVLDKDSKTLPEPVMTDLGLLIDSFSRLQ